MNDQLKHFTEDWSEEDVSKWLRAQGLEDLVDIFRTNNIDGKELLHLTKESLAGDLKIGKEGGDRPAVLRFSARSLLTSGLSCCGSLLLLFRSARVGEHTCLLGKGKAFLVPKPSSEL